MTTRSAMYMLCVLALVTLGAGEPAVHGEATLKSPSSVANAGEALTLLGTGFVPEQAHRLVLRGTLDEHELGQATAGADSTFTVEMTVPVDARPGLYRIVAIAPDGDEVATLEMPVRAAEPDTAVADAGAQGSGSAPQAAGPQARPDEIEIERSRAGLEWGVIGLIIGLAAGLGLGLMRRV